MHFTTRMGRRTLRTPLGLVLLATLSCTAYAAAPADRFVAGAMVTETAPVGGDLFAAGGSVDVDADVGGNAILAGGKVRVGAGVGESVYAAAGQVALLGAVAGNARLAGGQVELGADSRIAGNLTVAGGRIVVRGAVDGELGAAGGDVLIDATIAGDAEIAARRVELGPNARIAGSLRYRSAEPLERHASAQLGGVERLGPDVSAPTRDQVGHAVGIGLAILWTTGVMLLAAILVGLLPRLSALVSETLRTRPGLSALLGFVVLVCTPVAVIVLLATVIGIPLALLVLLVYLLLLPLAWVGSAIALGDAVLARVSASNAARTAWRVGAAVLAALALMLVTRVPWVGGLVAFMVLLAGLGAWALQLRRLAAR